MTDPEIPINLHLYSETIETEDETTTMIPTVGHAPIRHQTETTGMMTTTTTMMTRATATIPIHLAAVTTEATHHHTKKPLKISQIS